MGQSQTSKISSERIKGRSREGYWDSCVSVIYGDIFSVPRFMELQPPSPVLERWLPRASCGVPGSLSTQWLGEEGWKVNVLLLPPVYGMSHTFPWPSSHLVLVRHLTPALPSPPFSSSCRDSSRRLCPGPERRQDAAHAAGLLPVGLTVVCSSVIPVLCHSVFCVYQKNEAGGHI